MLKKTKHSAIALAFALLAISAVPGFASDVQNTKAKHIVSIGGSITEIVFALGAQDRIVGRDSTSVYPPAVNDIPDTGYIRAISAEGILSVNPDLILALEGAGPPEAMAVLQQAGVAITMIPEGYDGRAVIAKVLAVGDAIGEQEKAKVLAAQLTEQLAAAATSARAVEKPLNVLFVLSEQNGKLMVAGKDTHADGMITMAGAQNAFPDVTGYKPVNDEAIIEAAPDAILMMDRAGDHALSKVALLRNPAIAQTPAGKSGTIIAMDGMYLLGFGPRTPDALRDLQATLAAPSIKTE